MIRILIADDHEVVRRGVVSLVNMRPDFQVVAEAADGQEAIDKSIEFRPDVVIMDISMPKINGVEAIRRVRAACGATEVLALTMHSSETLARELLEAGARGYVLKSDAARDLVAAIDSLSQHGSFLSVATSNIVMDQFRRGNSKNERQRLSARETEMLRLLTAGKSNKEVANELFLSVRTVETHRANIMAKLNLHSIGELVQYAIRNNIVTV